MKFKRTGSESGTRARTEWHDRRREVNAKHKALLNPEESLRRGLVGRQRSSEEERRVDARALIAEEGRDKLRKALGSRK